MLDEGGRRLVCAARRAAMAQGTCESRAVDKNVNVTIVVHLNSDSWNSSHEVEVALMRLQLRKCDTGECDRVSQSIVDNRADRRIARVIEEVRHILKHRLVDLDRIVVH